MEVAMFGKSIVVAAVTILATSVVAVGVVTAGSIPEDNGPPTDLLGGEMLSCPDGTQVQSRFSRNGDSWEVTGILSTGLDGTITIAGPEEDVSATPTVNIVVSGDPQPGDVVTMAGMIPAVTGEMVATSVTAECPEMVPAAAAEVPPPAAEVAALTDEPDVDEGFEDEAEGVCNRGAGQSGELLMHENNGGVHIQRGQVVSVEGNTLSVQTPEGTMVVMIDQGTHLNGDPAAAFEVKVRGDMDDGVLIADEVKVLCPNPHGNDDGDDDERDNDDEGEGGHGNDQHEDKDKDDD
jgi:hypothetical protein